MQNDRPLISGRARGQSSLEYVLLLSGLLLLLIVIYGLSAQMSLRQQLLASQLEGERVAARLGRAIDDVAVIGPGASENLSLVSFPNQTIIASGAEVLALGPANYTLAVTHTLGNLTSATTFTADTGVQVLYVGPNIKVNPQG